MQFKIMTFNVRGSFNNDGQNAWEKRRRLNLATIKKYAPGIIGFQEAQAGNLEAYDMNLKAFRSEHGFPAPRDKGAEYIPLYWHHERFEKLASGAFYLSETPQIEAIGWAAKLVRPTTWLKLRGKSSNTIFLVLNTHFPHGIKEHETRKNCAKLIIEQIDTLASDLPTLVLGDFNALPDSLAYNAFLEQGFVDSYRAAGHKKDQNSFRDFRGANFPFSGIRIDWIMSRDAAQKFTITSCELIQDAEPPLYPSDHYPVMATLS